MDGEIVEVKKNMEVAPSDFSSIVSMADAFAKSGMFEGIKGAAQAVVKIIGGRELGLPPVYSMQNLHMVKGRLTTSAQTMALLIKSSGRYDYKVVESTAEKCVIEFYEKTGGVREKIGTQTWTIEDARRADLLKPDSGWVKFPEAMLFSRCLSAGARKYCPDAIGGIYTREEIEATDFGDGSVLEKVEPEKPIDSKYWCSKHQTLWFKSGKMRRYAHPISGTKEWCEMPGQDVQGQPQVAAEAQPEPAAEVEAGQSSADRKTWNEVMSKASAKRISAETLKKAVKAHYNLDVVDFTAPPEGMTVEQLQDLSRRIDEYRK